MRIGVAGTGRIGAFHAETLKAVPLVDSVVLADLDAARARTGWWSPPPPTRTPR